MLPYQECLFQTRHCYKLVFITYRCTTQLWQYILHYDKFTRKLNSLTNSVPILSSTHKFNRLRTLKIERIKASERLPGTHAHVWHPSFPCSPNIAFPLHVNMHSLVPVQSEWVGGFGLTSKTCTSEETKASILCCCLNFSCEIKIYLSLMFNVVQ